MSKYNHITVYSIRALACADAQGVLGYDCATVSHLADIMAQMAKDERKFMASVRERLLREFEEGGK